jgi:hypothetical protein
VRTLPKILCKLCELDVEPSTISHPHEDYLFLVKEASNVELGDDFLIPVVPKRQKLSDTMELTSFQDPIEVHIPLVPHIINVNPLSRNHWLGLTIENGVVPILMKECPEPLIHAPFLA